MQRKLAPAVSTWALLTTVVAAMSVAIGSTCQAENETPARPNIVLVLVDDLGWADLGCQGSKYFETPNIDRLAEQGMRFTNGYAACAVCSPTRAAVQTGRYPARVGVTDWIRAKFQGGIIGPDGKNPSGYTEARGGRLACPKNALFMELDELTIAEALKPAGYATCFIGKWHLGQVRQFPEQQGYDLNRGGCDLGQPPSYFDPYALKRQFYEIPNLPPRKEGEYLTDREGDEAVAFIRAHKEKPFFLSLCNYCVHTPLMGKKDVIAKYEVKPKTQQKNATYAAMVESVDDAVGQIMETLDECELTENTLFLFTSDNGGLLGPTSNAPLRSGKGFPYEGGIRVPLIIRYPAVAPAMSTCDVPAISCDFFPTLMEATGLAMPTDRVIDGVSLMPLLTGGKSLDRDALFWHFPHYRGKLGPYSIVRVGDWKLIRRWDPDEKELYNLADDLSETTDLAESNPQKVAELEAKLAELLKQTNAKMPRRGNGENETTDTTSGIPQ
jgi:arylsulfatase A